MEVQTQIKRVYVLDVSYNGSKGTGLDIQRTPNRSTDASNFIYLTNGGSSIYHGMTVQFSRRFSRGFNLTNTYTFSKSIDDVSTAQNDANLSAERALGNNDQRHNYQTGFTYELPIGKNRKYFANASEKLLNFIAGWTFNGTITLASGTPMTATYTSANGSTSGAAVFGTLRADATGIDPNLSRGDRTVTQFFNTAAFAIPSDQYGTAATRLQGPEPSPSISRFARVFNWMRTIADWI
jgi:hypothetical protein